MRNDKWAAEKEASTTATIFPEIDADAADKEMPEVCDPDNEDLDQHHDQDMDDLHSSAQYFQWKGDTAESLGNEVASWVDMAACAFVAAENALKIALPSRRTYSAH